MIALDCNILVQLALADHPKNAATVSMVHAETARGEVLGISPLIICEFLHVITDPRRFAPPLSMTEALEWAEEFLENPMVSLLEPKSESFHQTLRWMKQFNLGRKRILDSYLAATVHGAGGHRLLTSNPKDFEVFGVFDIISP